MTRTGHGVTDAASIARDVAAGTRSAEEVVRDALARVDAVGPALNAFLDVFHDRAIDDARALDRGQRPRGPLAGVPVALKDNICLDRGRTTCASRMLGEYRSPVTATAAQRLIDAGAIIVAKTNMDEFAMGSSGEHSTVGVARNPWDTSRVCGGSSSGSAAAVAARCVPIALGSDTGGSIRQPAGFCGVVGLKPTYGRVSRYGLVAFASSLDQVGPITRTVDDAALALATIAGRDARDATSSDRPAPAAGDLAWPEGATIALPRAALDSVRHPAVRAGVERAIEACRDAGARLIDVDLPHADHAVAAYYLIAAAEAASNLARYDGVRYGRRADLPPDASLDDLYTRSRSEGLGPEVQRRIMLGTYALRSGYADRYYVRAMRVRRRIKGDYDAAFARGAHALLLPTSPEPAFPIGERLDDPMALYLQDVFTVGANLAGLPAIAIPAGAQHVGAARLPVGVQLLGRPWDEASLLAIARRVHEALGTAAEAPPA